MTGLNVSKRIEDFCNFYNEMNKSYTYYYQRVNDCDKLKCDLLHKLELGDYKDRNEKQRLLTQIERCLKDRRYYKDRVEEMEPFIHIFKDPDKSQDNKNRCAITTMNNLTNCLGQVRKMEAYHADRTYKPRILKDEFEG